MNREIKFRAWNKEKNIMVYNNEDDTYGYWDGCCNSNVGMVNEILNSKYYEGYEFMQFTGLYDKNGKEIYEGDVVLYEDWEMAYEGGGNDSFINKGIIEYVECNCCFNVTERQTVELQDVLYKDNESLEVIGNIYDNPELLGGE